MFSCCRANPKKSKKVIEDISENNKNIKEIESETTNTDSKQLVIPTITIENGKTANDEQINSTTTATTVTVNANANASAISEKLVNGVSKNQKNETSQNIAKEVSEEVSLTETETATTTTTTTATTVTTVIKKAKNDIDSNNSDPSSSLSANENDASADINVADISTSNTSPINNLLCDTNLDDKPIDKDEKIVDQIKGSDKTISQEENQKQPNPPPKDSTNESQDTSQNQSQPKSCLSRHNSTHTSIKKRVNISTHAEIIEPEPLPPLLVKSASLGDDEDDVFSDSLPPPKRDSMCAPYIERDVDDDINAIISDSLAYSHGLPEWFNDERINDM